MLPQLVQHLLNSLYVLFAFILGIDKDVIEVHYNKNVELLCQDLVDIALIYGRCVSQSKKHDLIFKVTIAGPKGRLLFVAFPDPQLMAGIGQVELIGTFNLV